MTALVACASLQQAVPAKQFDYTRVMTYNIQWFHAGEDQKRIDNIKAILEQVKPDIVGVAEVQGKAALQQVFGADWQIGIKDFGDEHQETGICVKKPYKLLEYDMVFTAKELDYAFPGKRDVLRAVVQTPGGKNLVVYVNHFKSRSGGRLQTDPQRAMAAGMLASYIAYKGDENVVVLGDFNDAPNDAMANILESGDVKAPAGDTKNFKLLANVTEELCDKDYVTIDLHSLYFGEEVPSPVVRGAKAENDRLRGRDYKFPDDVKIPQTFFDQILVSPNLWARGAKAYVFAGVEAVRGLPGRVKVGEDEVSGARTVEYLENGTLASDHLPVYSDIRIN